MEIRILEATGALTDVTGRLLFPIAGEIIDVPEDQAQSMVKAKTAEAVTETSKPKTSRARKPKRTTVAQGPQETR